MNLDKTNLKEMKDYMTEITPTLDKHPDNAFLLNLKRNLSRWINRYKENVKSKRAEGYSAEFEKFWKMYDSKTCSKSEAYGSWCKTVDEPAVVIAAVIPYKKDCKAREISQKHATTWLNQKGWESYDVQERVKEEIACDICGKSYYSMISVRPESGQWMSVKACLECQKYNRWNKVDIKADRV